MVHEEEEEGSEDQDGQHHLEQCGDEQRALLGIRGDAHSGIEELVRQGLLIATRIRGLVVGAGDQLANHPLVPLQEGGAVDPATGDLTAEAGQGELARLRPPGGEGQEDPQPGQHHQEVDDRPPEDAPNG